MSQSFSNDPWASANPINSGMSSEVFGDLTNGGWGDYNSHTEPVVEDTEHTSEKVAKDQPIPKSDVSINKKTTNPIEEEENDDAEEEEEQAFESLQSNEWSSDVDFNPLGYRHNDDKTIIQVKEIPEKEGFVFKHINYLVVHNIQFSSDYYVATNQAEPTNHDETKVIRRYSDFVWLVDVLWKKYPYRLIPELPPKKFATEDARFLSKRQMGLQRFLYELMRHPVLSKENLVIMFMTVPNDFAGWKKFANIDLTDEFQALRVRIPRRFRIDMRPVLKGLRDSDTTTTTDDDETDSNETPNNSTSINSITQIWAESPVNHNSLDFVDNFEHLDISLVRLADSWSKFMGIVERIERREYAVALDHSRAAQFLDKFTDADTKVFGMDNMVENKLRQTDEESQNLNIINTLLKQAVKFFGHTKEIKDQEIKVMESETSQNFRKFQDYLAALHFLMQRVSVYRNNSEKEIHILLSRITKYTDKLIQIKGKSDIKGSDVDKLISLSTETCGKLNKTICRVICVKMTFLNEFKMYQKVKYVISEMMQNWFRERVKYGDMQQESLRHAFNDLQDMPLS